VAWTAIYIGIWYVSIRSVFNVIMVIACIFILWRKNIRESIIMMAVGFAVMIILESVMPFAF